MGDRIEYCDGDRIPKVILCIDDDEGVLRYERAALEREGYIVVSVSAPREGLRLAMAACFDCIVVDYEMPDLNGYQLAASIRKVRPSIPIVMLSDCDVPCGVWEVASAFVPKLSIQRFVKYVTALLDPVVNASFPEITSRSFAEV